MQHLLLLLLLMLLMLLPSWPGFQPTALSSRVGRLGQEQDEEERCYWGCGGTHFGAVRVYLMLRRLCNRHDSRTRSGAEPALVMWSRREMCRGCDVLKVDGETQVRKCLGSASSWMYRREETREHITIVFVGGYGGELIYSFVTSNKAVVKCLIEFRYAHVRLSMRLMRETLGG